MPVSVGDMAMPTWTHRVETLPACGHGLYYIRVQPLPQPVAASPTYGDSLVGDMARATWRSERPIMSVLDLLHWCGLKKREKRSGDVAVAATRVESELYSMRPLTCCTGLQPRLRHRGLQPPRRGVAASVT